MPSAMHGIADMIRAAFAALFCLVFSLPISGQDPEDMRESVAEFSRFFRRYKTAAERVEAISTLEGMDCAEALEQLIPLLDHDEQEVRAAAMRVVSSYRAPATFAGVLEELPKTRDQKKRALLIEVLGNAEVAAAVPVLVEIATTDRRAGVPVRQALARALGRLGDPAAVVALPGLLADQDAVVRLAAADAVARLRLRELAAEVIRLLEDPAWQVRSSAVKALGALRPQEAIEPLIDLMRDSGRLREDAAEALFRITARDFGTDPEMWSRQWETLKSIDWRIPTDEELKLAAESRKRSDAYYGKLGEASFGGVTTTSTRVLFIIDVSGSMEDRVVEKEKFDAGYADLKKLTIVKTELERTIESLGANTYFNIVAFATDVDSWKKRLVPANIVNKSSAVAWVRRLEAIGGAEAQELASAGLTGTARLGQGKTNTYRALLYPFGIDPAKRQPAQESSSKAVTQTELDTVFFLSDGRPSTGVLVDPLEILADVSRINESYRIVFHAIAIGEFQKEFLRTLARDSGGVFVDLGR